jgi:hypothetical protein
MVGCSSTFAPVFSVCATGDDLIDRPQLPNILSPPGYLPLTLFDAFGDDDHTSGTMSSPADSLFDHRNGHRSYRTPLVAT